MLADMAEEKKMNAEAGPLDRKADLVASSQKRPRPMTLERGCYRVATGNGRFRPGTFLSLLQLNNSLPR